MSAMQWIRATRLFDGAGFRGPTLLALRGGVVEAMEPAPASLPPHTHVLPADQLLVPGFIDVQVNGGGGVLFNHDISLDALARMAAAHRRFGTTGQLATLITDEPSRLRAAAALVPAALTLPGILGLHFEGPFLNRARKGIHPEECIRVPDADDLALLQGAAAAGGRHLVTLAPECAGHEAVHALTQAGLAVAAGHSEANAAQMQQAMSAGLTGVTHLFNAMSQMTARAPGIVGTALGDDRLFAGIICDGLHVDPLNLRAAFRAMGRERLMLVTDAMATAGSDLQSFTLNGRLIVLRDGMLTGPDGTLAGAHLTMIEALRNAMAMMGASLEDALVMASGTPARFLGDETRGRIAPGMAADFAVLTPGPEVAATCVGGMWAQA